MSEAVRTMMRMDAEAAQETAAQADAGFLWDFWYPAVRSTEIFGAQASDGDACWKFRWCWAGPPRESVLRCGIRVRPGNSTFVWAAR